MPAGHTKTRTRGRGGRRLAAVGLVLVLLWVALSAKLFLWPARDPVAGPTPMPWWS